MDTPHVLGKLKELFFSSKQRFFGTLFGLVLLLAIPVTTSLILQQQDIRQRASGTATEFGFNTHLNTNGAPGNWENLTLPLFIQTVDSLVANNQQWIRLNISAWETVTSMSPTTIVWDETNLLQYDSAINYARSKGLKLFITTDVPDSANGFSKEDYIKASILYHTQLANRYRGKIAVWQVFNEPDQHHFRDYSAIQFGQEVENTYSSELVDVLRQTRLAIKAVDPTILFTTSVGRHPVNTQMFQNMTAFLDILNPQLDVLALDIYPDDAYQGISNNLINLKNRFGKPIIIAETGIPTGDGRFNESQQGTVLKGIINEFEMASPMAILLYQYWDTLPTNDPTQSSFGLVKRDGNKKSSFTDVLSVMQPLVNPTPPRTNNWGKIANPELLNQKVKGVFFFAGPPNPSSTSLYTRHPFNQWLQYNSNIDFIFDQIQQIGANTIKLSWWGPNNENLNFAPTVSTIDVNKTTFEKANARSMMVAPVIEVSDAFKFYSEFPSNTTNLEGRIKSLLETYGNYPNWLQLYDKNGQPRKVIWLIETIHAGAVSPQEFAQAFDTVANKIEADTGQKIGFIIDPTPLPPNGSYDGPDPAALQNTQSLLAINPFNITSDGNSETERLSKAEEILKKWKDSSLPLMVNVLPGYDDHIVRSPGQIYGDNTIWRNAVETLAKTYETAGITLDIWNGFTEGYAFVPTTENGQENYNLAKRLFGVSTLFPTPTSTPRRLPQLQTKHARCKGQTQYKLAQETH